MSDEVKLQIVTLAEIKTNSRIDGSDEDSYLKHIGRTAEIMACNLMERTANDIIEEYGTIPEDIKHAILMITDHLYEHRGITSTLSLSAIPYTVDCILKPYIRF